MTAPLDVYVRIAKLRRRQKDLATRMAQVEASRDRWKAKAITRGQENARLRKRRAAIRRRVNPYGMVKLTPRELELIRAMPLRTSGQDWT